MKKCSKCGQQTEREPYDITKPILCYDCNRVKTTEEKPVNLKCKERKGPITIICNL